MLSKKTKITQTQTGVVKIGLKDYKFVGWGWNEQKYRSVGKAAVGAIAGTVVGGGLLGIAGAAVGGKRRDESKAVVHLRALDTNRLIQLIINCDIKTVSGLGKLTLSEEQ